jgi:hypothetical protein
MAGRGRLGEIPPIKSDKLFMLRNGRWHPLSEPVNYDRPFAGVSLAVSFAQEYQEKFGVDVGLIPCADGGSSLEKWTVGGQLYTHAVYQTRLARNISEVKAVLWHQGEADSDREQDARTYGERFMPIIAGLRKECGPGDVPVILGELGEFLEDYQRHNSGQGAFFRLVNRALAELSAKNPGMALAKAGGLVSNGDNLHFDASSLREFGRRYFEKYLELAGKQDL